MKEHYNLLIVDDSKMIRKAVARIFEGDDRIRVVGEAADGEEALEIILRQKPDVVTLDVEMPVMDGLTTLKHMMIQAPTPTVMLSTLTHEGATVTFDALKYGAVDFLPKPSNLPGEDLKKQTQNIINKVNLAARVEIATAQLIRTTIKDKPSGLAGKGACEQVSIMGTAEGGYGSLLKIIPSLSPSLSMACLAVIYAPTKHVDAFAAYLDTYSAVNVKRATDGEALQGATCYLGSGEEYVTVHSRNGKLFLKVSPSPFSYRRGSINMLMFSAAEAVGKRATGIVLTGEGEDGAEGLEEIIRVGGTAVIQDPRSCMYREMAKSAMDRCKADFVVSDTKIPEVIGELS